jgi:hypothetical protein
MTERVTTKTRVGVGIDFGTTYFGASIYVTNLIAEDGNAPVLQRQPIVPVYIHQPNSGYKQPTRVQLSMQGATRTVRVGADIIANTEFTDDPRQNVIHSRFKLFLGSDETFANVGDGPRLSAAELTAEVLRKVQRDVAKYLHDHELESDDIPVRYAFSYPGAFPERAREAFIAAIRAAGFTNFSLLDEALATGLAVAQRNPHLHSATDGKVLVCDLGGGTLDLAVISITAGGWLRLQATHASHARLGMANLDYALALHALAQDALLPHAVADRIAAGHLAPAADSDDWSKLRISPAWRETLLRAAEAFKVIECHQQRGGAYYTGVLKLPTQRSVTIPEAIFTSLVDEMRSAVQQAVQTYLHTTIGPERLHENAIAPQSIRYFFIGGGGGALPGLAEMVQHLVPKASNQSGASEIAAALVQHGAAVYALEPQHIYDKRPTKNYGVKVFKKELPAWPTPEAMLPDATRGLEVPRYAHFEILIARDQVITVDTPIVTRYFPPMRGMKTLPFIFMCGTHDDPNHPDNERLGEIIVDLPDDADTNYALDCSVEITREALFKASVRDRQRDKIFALQRQVPVYVRDWALGDTSLGGFP